MTSDFLRRILLSPVNPISLNVISHVTDVEEKGKQNNKNKNGSAVNVKFHCNLKEGILQIYSIPNISLRVKIHNLLDNKQISLNP